MKIALITLVFMVPILALVAMLVELLERYLFIEISRRD